MGAAGLLTPVPRIRPVGRYAPSPTGDLHLGNLRTALAAWQHCRRLGGIFILRIEDIDGPRTVGGAEERIADDLRWLGLDWDEGPGACRPAGPYRQSERGAIYEAALEALAAKGLTYLCTCNRRDLREASAPHGPADGLMAPDGPIYPGVCRAKRTDEQASHPMGAATRLRTDGVGEIAFEDECLGPFTCDLASLSGDFVIRRRDCLWAYQLACAVDDALMGVTHVVRGLDLLTSTPRQIAIIRALGLPEPRYAHVPLVMDGAGRRMSKRDGSCSLRQLRSAGVTPEQARARILGMAT
jgi:glutamyl-tRNA synthetase